MKKWYVLLLLAGWCTALTAQVKIKEDPLITRMVETYVNGNKAKASVEGWRVQLLATTDRQRLESVKQSFQYRYPNIPIDWVHSSPYYQLRAGAFTTKLEALRLKYILEREYTGIYLVKDDKIKPEELVGSY
ncbi:MAG: SPOR domain-containing protein [Saprospiraceae bacterium]|nr:SPOR domain-containing protein [Saprospiraceae bacterium]